MASGRFCSLNLLLIVAMLASPLCFTRAARAEEKKKKTELDKKMEVMDEGMKKLKRTLRRPADDAQSIKLIGQIIDAATAAKGMQPAKASTLTGDARKKFIDEYQQGMTKLISTMGDMKKAVEAGDHKKALALHKSLKNQEDDGHDKFMESDDKPTAKSDK